MAHRLHVLDRLALLLPQLARLAALAVGQRDHLRVAAGAGADRDRAAGAPDEVGRVRADDEQPPAHPASRALLTTVMVWISSSVKPMLEQPLREQRQPVLDRRVRRLPEVGREQVVLDARGPDPRREMLPRALAGVRRREAALEHRAARRQRDLIVDRQVLRRELRVRDDDVADAARERRVDDREDLVAAEVAGREHELMARDDADHVEQRRQRRAGVVEHRHRRRLEPDLAQLALDPHPHRRVGVLAVARAGFVDGVDRRQPHDPRALARRDLHRERVEAADGGVQRDRADRRGRRGPTRLTTRARSAVDV